MSLDTIKEPEIVSPQISIQKALENWKGFQDLKTQLLDKNDYMSISGKNFIKKSGWRKLAVVFNVSDTVIYGKKEERPDGSFLWEFSVQATAPNGRTSIGVGSCDSKERNFAHKEHDVRATAHTRAKSRAISDLIGAGEISAEEMDAEEFQTMKNVTKKETVLFDGIKK